MTEITAHFHARRIQVLRRHFKPTELKRLWRSVVKGQMRAFEIVDLHDYYDFTRAIESRAKQVCDLVLDGRFRASKPLLYRLEKKLGIKRHMTVTSPFDALVLQAIVEAVRPNLEKAQPSKGAYYSQDKHHLRLPHELKKSAYDVWWLLWPKFQKEIFQFTAKRKYLVVSDLTNYYDSLDLRALRTAIVHKIKAPEVLIDLMFTIIEDLGWSPDYLPRRNVGLPVVHLESFRFLAHVFLFDADEVLKKRTKKNFVRWMDDINFGVDTEREATKTLSDLSDTLKSRGLSLNLAKTQILTAKQAKLHFCFSENVALDKISIRIEKGAVTPKLRVDLRTIFDASLKSPARNSDKIAKRALRLLGKLGSSLPIRVLEELFVRRAALRSNVASYLTVLGYSARRAKLVLALAKEATSLDDGARFAIRDLLLAWNIPTNKQGVAFVKKLLRTLEDFEGEVGFCTALVIFAKYAQPHELLTFIEGNRGAWNTSNFAHRQVISVMPRLMNFRPDKVEAYLNSALNSGKADVVSVAKNLFDLMELSSMPTDVRMTFFPTKSKPPYPVSKFLILKWLYHHAVTAPYTQAQIEHQLNDGWFEIGLQL